MNFRLVELSTYVFLAYLKTFVKSGEEGTENSKNIVAGGERCNE